MVKRDQLRLFISYSRADSAFVDRLQIRLEERGFQCLVDRDDIDDLEAWRSRIEELIVLADVVVFVITPDSIHSRECNWEISHARINNKRLAPIVWKVVDNTAVPTDLSLLQYIFFNPPNKFDDAVNRLSKVLSGVTAWERLHSELLDQAWKWAKRGRPSSVLLRAHSLRQAEQWLLEQPAGSHAPAALHREFIRASADAAQRRRRNWGIGTAVVLFALAQIALLSFFYRNDASLNEARYLLEHRQIEKAQRIFKDVVTHPMAKLLPDSSSKVSLATQFLDSGIMQTLVPFERSISGPARPLQGGSIVGTPNRLFAIANHDGGSLLFRCDVNGAECVGVGLDKQWRFAQLVLDGERAFLISLDADNGKGKLARIPDKDDLQISPIELPRSDVKNIHLVDDSYFWIGEGFSKRIGFRHDDASQDDYFETGGVFSVSPPVSENHQFFKTGVPPFILPANTSLPNASACSLDLSVCVAYFIDLNRDAHGTLGYFDMWSLGIVTDGRGKRTQRWERRVPELLTPTPTDRTAVAVSGDGYLIAVSDGQKLYIWKDATTLSQRREAWLSVESEDIPVALAFIGDSRELIFLTEDGLKRFNPWPRAKLVEGPKSMSTVAVNEHVGMASGTDIAESGSDDGDGDTDTEEVPEDAGLAETQEEQEVAKLANSILHKNVLDVMPAGEAGYIVMFGSGDMQGVSNDEPDIGSTADANGDEWVEDVASGSGGDSSCPSDILLVARNSGSLTPQILLRNTPFCQFEDDLIHVSECLRGEPCFFGAYSFPGVFSWGSETAQLLLYLFDLKEDTSSDTVATARNYILDASSSAPSGIKQIDLADLTLPDINFGMTYLTYSHAGRKIGFFGLTGRIFGNSYNASLLALDTMSVHLCDNDYKSFWDIVLSAKFSQNGRLILTKKEESGYEMFLTMNGQKVNLMDKAVNVAFSDSSTALIELEDGRTVQWAVPEAANATINTLLQLLH